MKQFKRYINPLSRLGMGKYSISFSLLFSLLVSAFSEFYAYEIAHNPMAVGSYIIFVNVALILYFSFRDGIRGGVVTSFVAICYYFYIIYTRNYSGDLLIAGIETTLILGVLYFLLAWIIGWLKQKIDTLIIREADKKKWLQAIIRQLPVGIIIADDTGKVLETNKQLEKILGKKIPSGLIAGKDMILSAYQNGKKVNGSASALAQVLETGKEVVDREFVIEKSKKEKVHISVSASPIQNTGGNIVAAASIVKDITNQKEMEMRKDDFINMASHELKTPVTSMKLYLDLLERNTRTQKNKKVDHIINSLHDQTDRLQELVNNLLDVSRIQTGKLSFRKETFRLDTVMKELIEALQEGIDTVKIIFKKHKSTLVVADKFRIYQVLTNLLTNAIKYSPDGGRITVSVETNRKSVLVSISDQGIGIARDQQRKIFDRLYQVTDSTEKTFPGLGMGLYISKEIIKRHRGRIWVKSEKGKGSTFFFTLPLK